MRALFTIFGIVTFVFFILRMSGDPVLQILRPEAEEDAIQLMRVAWGLDKSIWQQYVIYISNLFHGDLGSSYLDGRDAFAIVIERLPKTLSLMGITAIVTIAIGIPAGVYAALHRNTVIDRATMSLAVMGLSIPNFFLG